MSEMFVYRVTEADLDSWKRVEDFANPWSAVQHGVVAALEVRRCVPELAAWDGYGEYWMTPCPLKQSRFVMVRPGGNPYSEAYLVTPIALPTVEGLTLMKA